MYLIKLFQSVKMHSFSGCFHSLFLEAFVILFTVHGLQCSLFLNAFHSFENCLHSQVVE